MEIGRLLKKNLAGHINSLSVDELRDLDLQWRSGIDRRMRDQKSDIIFSCEGWLRSLARPESLDFMIHLLAGQRTRRTLEVIAFVRPPVTWINSAWWQWGAWRKRGSFDDWLEGAILASSWDRFLEPLSSRPEVSRLIVEPVRDDVVEQLRGILAIDSSFSIDGRVNVSLPPEALLLCQQFPELRPGPHQARMDHLIVSATQGSGSAYRSAPWVLTRKHVQMILRRTKPSVTRLLDFLDRSSREHVLADPRWWDADAFADRIATDPFDAGSAGELQMEHLAHDLLSALDRAVRILQGHDLVELYLRASNPAQD